MNLIGSYPVGERFFGAWQDIKTFESEDYAQVVLGKTDKPRRCLDLASARAQPRQNQS